MHFLFVNIFGIHPWKLGGMAMYTNAHLVEMDIKYYHNGGQFSRVQRRFISNETNQLIDKYYYDRKILGDLTPKKQTNELMDQLFNEFDDMDSIQIWFVTHYLPFNKQKAELKYNIVSATKPSLK